MTQNIVPLPTKAPIMVLPGAVLFPNTMLPLRIFEPRYRAMLEWALEHDRMFCVALMKPGITEAETEDQFFHTAGIGLVAASVTQPDSTSNLMLQGVARVRFTGFSQRAPFRMATIEIVPDLMSDPAKADALARKLIDQCEAIRVNSPSGPVSFADLLTSIDDPCATADNVANSLLTDPMHRQRFIEQQDTEVRLRELIQVVRAQFPAR